MRTEHCHGDRKEHRHEVGQKLHINTRNVTRNLNKGKNYTIIELTRRENKTK